MRLADCFGSKPKLGLGSQLFVLCSYECLCYNLNLHVQSASLRPESKVSQLVSQLASYHQALFIRKLLPAISLLIKPTSLVRMCHFSGSNNIIASTLHLASQLATCRHHHHKNISLRNMGVIQDNSSMLNIETSYRNSQTKYQLYELITAFTHFQLIHNNQYPSLQMFPCQMRVREHLHTFL